MRARRCAPAKTPASPLRILSYAPLSYMYRAKDFSCGVRERPLNVGERSESYKVKPVAGVAEVGRIRVTDQRAPREPAPGNPPRRRRRRRRRGPRLIESAYREQNSRSVYPTILCLPARLPSSSLSPFVRRSLVSVSLSRRGEIVSQVLFPFLVAHFYPLLLTSTISFAYHACAVSSVVRAALSTIFRSLF